MSFIEGGNFNCGEHKFTTTSFADWENHLTESGHTEDGEAPCVYCGSRVLFKDNPYTKRGMPKFVRCDKHDPDRAKLNKFDDNVKVPKTSESANKEVKK